MKTIKFFMALGIVCMALFACNKNSNRNMPLDSEKTFETLKKPQGGDIEDLIRPLLVSQYNTSTFLINKVGFQKDRDAQITTLYFTTGNEIPGTLIHLKTGKQPIRAGKYLLAANKEYIIDCTGSCNCKERYYPENGAVECTCDQCVMKIIEITP